MMSFLVWPLGSLALALRLRWSLLGSLCQQAAVRLAALCRCGRCGGPRRWYFSAGASANIILFCKELKYFKLILCTKFEEI
jgi:hypothetical protein